MFGLYFSLDLPLEILLLMLSHSFAETAQFLEMALMLSRTFLFQILHFCVSHLTCVLADASRRIRADGA